MSTTPVFLSRCLQALLFQWDELLDHIGLRGYCFCVLTRILTTLMHGAVLTVLLILLSLAPPLSEVFQYFNVANTLNCNSCIYLETNAFTALINAASVLS